MTSLLIPQTYSELERWAQKASKTDMVPKAYRGRPDDIVICITYGSQLGFSLLESLRSIAVINGMPSVFGDGLLALAQRHPEWDGHVETPELDSSGEVVGYTCEVRRVGVEPVTRTFTRNDAIKAGLWQDKPTVTRRSRDGQGTYEADNDSPWFRYPQRMLQMRARSWALRDQFADALQGAIQTEEAQDHATIQGIVSGTVSDEQVRQIADLLDETKTERTAFLTTMFSGIDKLEDIPANDFQRAYRVLLRKKESVPQP